MWSLPLQRVRERQCNSAISLQTAFPRTPPQPHRTLRRGGARHIDHASTRGSRSGGKLVRMAYDHDRGMPFTIVRKGYDKDEVRRYFVEEKIFALPLSVAILAVISASGIGSHSPRKLSRLR